MDWRSIGLSDLGPARRIFRVVCLKQMYPNNDTLGERIKLYVQENSEA
jgi:hypothetical protein